MALLVQHTTLQLLRAKWLCTQLDTVGHSWTQCKEIIVHCQKVATPPHRAVIALYCSILDMHYSIVGIIQHSDAVILQYSLPVLEYCIIQRTKK